MKKKNLNNPDRRSSSGTEIIRNSGTMTIYDAKEIIRQEGWITAEEYIKQNNLQLDPKKLSERVKQTDPKDFSERAKETLKQMINARLGVPGILAVFPERGDMVYVLRGQDIPNYRGKEPLINKIISAGDSLEIYHKIQ